MKFTVLWLTWSGELRRVRKFGANKRDWLIYRGKEKIKKQCASFLPFLLFWRINSKKKNRKWYIGVFRGNWNCITCESCVNYRLENRRFSESRRLPHRFSGSPDCVTAGDHVTPQVCQTFFRKRERPVSQNYTKSPAVKRPFSKFPSPPRSLFLSLQPS